MKVVLDRAGILPERQPVNDRYSALIQGGRSCRKRLFRCQLCHTGRSRANGFDRRYAVISVTLPPAAIASSRAIRAQSGFQDAGREPGGANTSLVAVWKTLSFDYESGNAVQSNLTFSGPAFGLMAHF